MKKEDVKDVSLICFVGIAVVTLAFSFGYEFGHSRGVEEAQVIPSEGAFLGKKVYPMTATNNRTKFHFSVERWCGGLRGTDGWKTKRINSTHFAVLCYETDYECEVP